MKKIMIMLICWSCTLGAFAQDIPATNESTNPNGINTIFGKTNGISKIPLGYFIEIDGGFTRFGHKSVFLPGMSMGLILNHHWTVGLTGTFIGNPMGMRFHNKYYNNDRDSTGFNRHGHNLSGGYGGVLLEYTLFPKSRIHVAFPLMLGSGTLSYSHRDHDNDTTFLYDEGHHHHMSGNHFFVIEPGVRVECNVIKTLRIGFGISYRYAPDLGHFRAPSDLINQFNAKLSLRFGKF
ncbi:MAG: hypothetical protein M0Q38_02805 [Bacteroidales bacterium]|nr:hypothetical protein [Bacteroidales bacterium]